MDFLAEEILNFWIGPLNEDGMPEAAQQKRWFMKDPAFDETIKKRFGQYLEPAGMGAFDRWAESHKGRVAEVILLDQFPRNLYREQARSLYYDRKALHLCMKGLEQGQHLELPASYAYFLLMPTMHAEDLAIQEQGIEAFRAVRDKSQGAAWNMLDLALNFADRHREIIARFGRFPHRNEALGRESTAEEVAFLKEPGSHF